MRKTIALLATVVFVLLVVFSQGKDRVNAGYQPQAQEGPGVAARKGGAAVFDETGALVKPRGYREWVFVGGPVTPNDINGGRAAFPEFHDVYIDRASFDSYRRTGRFRDGTMLVKELLSIGTRKAASGKGAFPGDFTGLAAAVKDSRRFPKEPGNWAYFSFSPGTERAAAAPAAACNSCHRDNAAGDWVFTQYYPVLRAARQT